MKLLNLKTITMGIILLGRLASADILCRSTQAEIPFTIHAITMNPDEHFHLYEYKAVAILNLNGDKKLLKGSLSQTPTRVGIYSNYKLESEDSETAMLKVSTSFDNHLSNCNKRIGCDGNPFIEKLTGTFMYQGSSHAVSCKTTTN